MCQKSRCSARNRSSTSVQAGLRSIAIECQAALLAVGDMPAIERDVVAQIIQAYQAAGRDMVCIPSYQKRAGHPVLVPRSYWEAILSLPHGDSLRSVLRAKNTHVRWVVVDTPSVLRDMDTPADYKRELELRHRQE